MKWYSRGIAAADEDILVVNGSQQGIDLICKALVGKNTVVLAEDPSYSVALHCSQRAGARVVTVPLLADGPDMDAIRAVVDQTPIDFYYTMTHFQCPSNVCWSERKRREMLALAQANSFTIVEDDCLGDLAFNGRPRQTLRGLDSGNTVLYLNSFSKSLVPGLRLGYLLVPGRYEKRLILAKFNANIASPALLQKMLALYLQRGLYAAHLERLVAQYASKRRCMSQAIRASKHLSLPYPEQAGGVFFWVQIPDAVDAVLLWKRLRLQGVKLMPGTVFSLTGSAQRFLRLSYVGCPLEMIPEGIHCIDREIDWLLQNGAAHVGDSFCDIALPQQ
ncbi:MAG: PLP-dependent aminotransferase family protein [Oscillospiraceae bacterium]